jgi:thiamine monophosphate synthase
MHRSKWGTAFDSGANFIALMDFIIQADSPMSAISLLKEFT